MQTVTCPHCNRPTAVDEEKKIKKTAHCDRANPFASEPRADCEECGKEFSYRTRAGIL